MRARVSTALPVCEISPKTFFRLEDETNHSSDHEFPQVLEDFISTNFEPDAQVTNLSDREYGRTIPNEILTVPVGLSQHLTTTKEE